MKTALVMGAGGFIGSHMVTRLKNEGYWVRGCDLKKPEFSDTLADEFIQGDLRDLYFVENIIRFHGERGNYWHKPPRQHHKPFDEIYQFAADMGGAEFVFTGENDADIMHNSATINLNVLDELRLQKCEFKNFNTRIFYSSSACMYPERNQLDPDNPDCREESAYPAEPDSEYGWEKLFSERLYAAYARNHGIDVRIGRYHNIYGPEGTWQGGREKAPAAMCRKIAMIDDGSTIDCFGDGEQTRSFLYIDECIEATRRLMESDYDNPINIGSEQMVTINELIETVAFVAGKTVKVNHISGPLGVRGRNSNNDLVRKILNWDYTMTLEQGIRETYYWIKNQIENQI